MKKLLFILFAAMTLVSCADSKKFKDADGNEFVAEPYGWADYDKVKKEGVVYEVCVGNLVWDVLLSESLIVPIWLTGWQFYEPVDYVPVKKAAPVAPVAPVQTTEPTLATQN